MVGILVSYWEGLFSGAMLVSGRVYHVTLFITYWARARPPWLRTLRMGCFIVMPPRNSLPGWPMDVFLHEGSLKRYVAMKQAWEQQNPPIGVLADCLEDVPTLKFKIYRYPQNGQMFKRRYIFQNIIFGINDFLGCTLFVYHCFLLNHMLFHQILNFWWI